MKLQSTILCSLSFLVPLPASSFASPLLARQSSVSDYVLGQLCNSVTGPGTDPTETICDGQLVAQDINGNTIATASLGVVTNRGQDNVTEFCATYATDFSNKVKLTLDGATYDFGPFYNCVPGRSIGVEEVKEGVAGSRLLSFYYDRSISVGENPAAGLFYPSFVHEI